MLDTNILIYLMKEKPRVVADRVDALDATDTLCMSFVTYAELLSGAERSSRKPLVLRQLERLTYEVPVVYDTGRTICQHYAAQFTRLRRSGTPIGANDLWIACHALAIEATVVTNNLRELERVQGLRLENWAA